MSEDAREQCARALEDWARRDKEHRAERDELVRAAALVLVRDGGEPNVRQIALRTGLSRNTVYAILGADAGGEESQ